MNVLVVGDLHAKQPWILPYITRVIQKYHVTQVITLGDYVDDWGVSDNDIVKSLKFHIEWLGDMKSSDVSVVSLLGNHDASYLWGGRQFGCSGHHYSIEREVRDMLYSINLLPCYELGGTLYTHAGVLKKWADNVPIYNPDNISDVCNKIYHMNSNLKGNHYLYQVSYTRGGVDDCSGPLWADMKEFVAERIGVELNQIVGHTPVTQITTVEGMNNKKIRFCDTFSTSYLGDAIGNGSVLLITSDEVNTTYKQITPEYVGLPSWKDICTEYIGTNRPLYS